MFYHVHALLPLHLYEIGGLTQFLRGTVILYGLRSQCCMDSPRSDPKERL